MRCRLSTRWGSLERFDPAEEFGAVAALTHEKSAATRIPSYSSAAGSGTRVSASVSYPISRSMAWKSDACGNGVDP